MVKAVVVEKTGGPEVLQIKDIKLAPLKDGEVRIKQSVIGLNFIDIRYRRGDKKINLPATLGFEGCGYVEETKGDVGDLKKGDRVAYATGPMGAYCYERNIDHKYLVGVPDGVSDEQAVAVLFKGMTAHYLAKRTFYVRAGVVVLIHAAAGGVGMYLTKICKAANATVIGTVGSDEKLEIAKNNGCDYVINYNKEDFHKKVMEFTNNEGVWVVYDAVGKNTFDKSLACLIPFGLMVSYGSASGKIPAFDLEILEEKGIFITRPTLFQYKHNRMELALSASEVFNMLKNGVISDNINLKYKLDEIQLAHQDIEKRLTVGSNLIVL